MQKRLMTALFTAATLFTVAGCSSNQAVEPRVANYCHRREPEVDNDTGMVSYKNAATGKTEQINRDQLKNMSELDN